MAHPASLTPRAFGLEQRSRRCRPVAEWGRRFRVSALLRHIALHRYVLLNFVRRDIKVKYRGTFLGYLWTLLEPLALVAVYYFVFVVIARRGDDRYVLVVSLGLLPWIFFSAVITQSATALTGNASLIRRVPIPREIYVVAALLSNFVVLLLSMLALVPVLYVLDLSLTPRVLLWPVAMTLLGAIALGIGLVISCLNVIFRDVSYLIRVALRLGLYCSAVIFPVTMVPERFRDLFLLNPLAVCLAMGRDAFLGGELELTPFQWGWTVCLCLGSVVVGAALFGRLERHAVKFL